MLILKILDTYDRANQTTFTLNAIITFAMTEGDINRAVAIVTQNFIKAAGLSISKSSDCQGKDCR